MVTIRKGRTADLPQLIRLYKGVKEITDFAGQRYDKGYFEMFLHSRATVVLVAVNGEDVVGALNAEFADLGGYTYLNNIVVSKNHCKEGIGGMLMNELERIVKKRRHVSILALVFDWNKNMQAVMRHQRYVPTGKTIIYAKKLAKVR